MTGRRRSYFPLRPCEPPEGTAPDRCDPHGGAGTRAFTNRKWSTDNGMVVPLWFSFWLPKSLCFLRVPLSVGVGVQLGQAQCSMLIPQNHLDDICVGWIWGPLPLFKGNEREIYHLGVPHFDTYLHAHHKDSPGEEIIFSLAGNSDSSESKLMNLMLLISAAAKMPKQGKLVSC